MPPPPFLLLQLPVLELARSPFSKFLRKTSSSHDFHRQSLLLNVYLRLNVLLDLSWFLAETHEKSCVGCAAELCFFDLAFLWNLSPCSVCFLLPDSWLESLKVLTK